MTVRSNPRILFIYIFMAVLLIVGGAVLFLAGVIFGLIALAIALFFSWTLLRLTRRQLATRIETLTDEVLIIMQGDEKVLFPWEKIRIAGMATEEGERPRGRRILRRLFIYNEQEDRMIAVTDEFENLDGLAAELREKTDFREIVLAPGETLKGKLRELVGQS
jgi:hypothetical protein